MMFNQCFWKEKKVFITGHTGFKGSWLSSWLYSMNAKVYGYSLMPPTEPNLYTVLKLDDKVESSINDIRDLQKLKKTMVEVEPEIVFHMAAQPLVRLSYVEPVETYEVNVIGTANVLEAVKHCPSVKVVVVITTDKCYENKEWYWGYRENEALGGYDPYSSSKACAELVTASYRNSFFNIENYSNHGVCIASVRAGNVIGGGDWAENRLIPDCVKALMNNQTVIVRNPNAIRPWQHVLEPLYGYLKLAEDLFNGRKEFASAWNFGPSESNERNVGEVVKCFCRQWGNGANYVVEVDENSPHEANYLKLDSSNAKMKLKWHSVWDLETSVEKIVTWTKLYQNKENMFSNTLSQINEYMSVISNDDSN